jgi:hypothetical protein
MNDIGLCSIHPPAFVLHRMAAPVAFPLTRSSPARSHPRVVPPS